MPLLERVEHVAQISGGLEQGIAAPQRIQLQQRVRVVLAQAQPRVQDLHEGVDGGHAATSWRAEDAARRIPARWRRAFSVARQGLWDGKSPRVPLRRPAGDAWGMLDLLLVTLAVLRAACRSRGDLVLENLLLRHQLAVVTRPARRGPARLRRPDKLLWVLVRRLRRNWRRHLVAPARSSPSVVLVVLPPRRRPWGRCSSATILPSDGRTAPPPPAARPRGVTKARA